jgi:hypothetical protein
LFFTGQAHEEKLLGIFRSFPKISGENSSKFLGNFQNFQNNSEKFENYFQNFRGISNSRKFPNRKFLAKPCTACRCPIGMRVRAQDFPPERKHILDGLRQLELIEV